MMKPWDSTRLARIILALACALGLSACSAVKLGYNALPELGYWWLDGYADFSDGQQPRVRDALARLHDWHRANELPRLGALLARLEQMAPGEITPQQACEVVSEVQERLNALALQALPDAAAIATSLNARQLRHLERKFRSINETFRQDWLEPAPAQMQDKRYERMLDRIEMIYGRLDAPQRAVLRQGIVQSVYDPARSLADWQRRQQDLLQTLRHLHGPQGAGEAQPQLQAWLDRAQHSPDLAYRAWQEGLLQEGCRIFAGVHQSTTSAQREQAVRRLRAYQRDLRELAPAQ